MKKDNHGFSAKIISKTLLAEIKKALISVEKFGSVEIYVQDGEVNQITTRKIKKTAHLSGMKSKIGNYISK